MTASARRQRVAASLLFLASLVAPRAQAQAQGEDAASLLRRGVELRRENRNEEALALFARAVAASPTPVARAELALAEQALGRWLDAERDLDAALAARDDAWIAKHAASLEDALGVIRQHLAWITVDVDVAAAEARLDGRAVPPAKETRVAAGSFVLEVTAPGYVPDARRVALAASEHARVSVTLTPIAAPAPSRPEEPVAPTAAPAATTTAPRDEPAPSRPARSLVGPIALGAAGVVGLAAGTYFGLRTFQKKSDRDAACVGGCTSAAITFDSEARNAATASTIAFGAGAALVAGAGIWWFLGRDASDNQGSSVSVAPSVGAVNGVVLRGAL
jgi:hypothetical protein